MPIKLSNIPAPRFSALPLPERAPMPSMSFFFLRELWLMLRVISLLLFVLTCLAGAGGLGALVTIELILRPAQ